MADTTSSLVLFARTHSLACLVLCYLAFITLGAVAFLLLEKPAEQAMRAEVDELRLSFLQEHACVEESRLTELLEETLAARRRDAGGRRCSFAASLYFVIVTLTTIGSDTCSPKSDEAKLFCVLYCSLGTPLTLSLLGVLSDVLLPVLTHTPCTVFTPAGGSRTARPRPSSVLWGSPSSPCPRPPGLGGGANSAASWTLFSSASLS
ncbi:potassium channel, subfamily K, member 7 [Brachionichthys hirsutus]|uniref:potassium channel, subfamily K, member 7 n=1 Tax=Brachionichthys hirsutus TaxID=412623 RepID=UPI00360511A5